MHMICITNISNANNPCVCVCVFSPDNLFKPRDRATTGKEMPLRSKRWVTSQSLLAAGLVLISCVTITGGGGPLSPAYLTSLTSTTPPPQSHFTGSFPALCISLDDEMKMQGSARLMSLVTACNQECKSRCRTGAEVKKKEEEKKKELCLSNRQRMELFKKVSRQITCSQASLTATSADPPQSSHSFNLAKFAWVNLSDLWAERSHSICWKVGSGVIH